MAGDEGETRRFMDVAFGLAREALAAQEVPVGCVFVRDGEVVAVGRNSVNESRNATRHAEMNCIDLVQRYCRERRLDPAEAFASIAVFVTVEPCVMCAAALYDLGVESVVYGCANDRFGGRTVFDVAAVLNPTTVMRGGVREAEAMDLLKEFYKGTNPNAPPSKAKVKSKTGRKSPG